MYTFDQLKEDVRKEAEALRVHATKEELGRLDFKNFHPDAMDGCIYGQLSLTCYSSRAAQLIHLCAHRYFKHEMFNAIEKHGVNGISRAVNGRTVDGFIDTRMTMETSKIHYSAIEAYILLPEAKNANLIAYLKGESETLEL